MKVFFTALLLFLSLYSQANGMSEYTQKLKETLSEELLEIDGQLSSLKCINHFVGVLCYSTLEFEQNDSLSCKETYYFLGFGEKVYQRLCSTCWFNDGEDIFKPTCD
jgi:hypothetical protein